MAELTAGLTGEVRAKVEGDLVTDRGGGVRVLSTPSLVRLLEHAAIAALTPHLAPGEITVGSGVNVQHVAATPEGHTVVARATLTEVEGRKLVFKVEACDPFEQVAFGSHERYVLDGERYGQRLQRKQAAPGSG